MNPIQYLIIRVARLLLMLFAVITVLFVMFRVMPSDPTDLMIARGDLTAEQQAAVRESLGLGRPIHEQFGIFIINVFRGDFGISFTYRRPVMDILLPRLATTVVILLPVMVLDLITAYYLGSILGWRKGDVIEKFGTYLPVTLRALPIFVTGLFILIIFSYRLGWFPTGGIAPPGQRGRTLVEHMSNSYFYHHAALFALTAYVSYFASASLVMRANIIKERGEPYIQLLHLKGLPEKSVRNHAAKNSLLPLITWATPLVGIAFGGAVILEVIFSWPGIGRELVRSVARRDFPVAQGAFFIIAAAVLTANFLIDLAYGYFDPRVSYTDD